MKITVSDAQAAYDKAVSEHGKRSVLASIALQNLREAMNRALRKEIREDRKKRRQAA